MTKRRIQKNSKGLSMIELMVSMTIIMVGLMGFMQMSLLMSRSNTSSRNANEAAVMVQNTVEDIGATEWGNLGTDSSLPASNGLSGGEVRTLGPLNRLSEDSSSGGDGPFSYMQHVVVCTNSTTTSEGADPERCVSSIDNSNRPPELVCDGSSLSAREKLIRVLISWTNREGTCRFRSTDSLAFQ